MSSIFNSDPEAFLFVFIIAISLVVVNKLLSYLFSRIGKIPVGKKNNLIFIIRIASILTLLYFVINGFPSFTTLPPETTAIVTGALSTALAFVTSGIFSNFVAGVLLWIIDPIDIGDVVKISGHKGVIKSITLTKVVIETLDRILVEISNSDVVSSIVLNYTIKLSSRKKYFHFKRQIRSPQDIGNARLNIDAYNEVIRKQEEIDVKNFFNSFSEDRKKIIHSYNFKMRVPFGKFRIKVYQFNKLCDKYGKMFGFRPHFHVLDFSNEIFVKFRILTLDSDKLLKFQPQFAKELYKIILG